MDIQELNAKNPEFERTKKLKSYRAGGFVVDVCKTKDGKMCFDIESGDQVLSMAFGRKVHTENAHSHYGRHGRFLYDLKGEVASYNIEFVVSGQKETHREKIYYDDCNPDCYGDIDRSLKADFDKGIPGCEHKQIFEGLSKKNKTLADLFNKCVLPAEELSKVNDLSKSTPEGEFNRVLDDFLHGGRK